MKKIMMMCLVLLVVTSVSFAKEETSALMSKNCDEAKIKELAGAALIKITAQDWGDGLKGFTVTLDNDKMTIKDLTDKMHAAGCN